MDGPGALACDARYYTDPPCSRPRRPGPVPHLAVRRHASDLENPGDYVSPSKWRREPVRIRGRDGVIRTFYNVCQHRAHQLVRARAHARGRLPLPRLDL
jgi:hypothetical protein